MTKLVSIFLCFLFLNQVTFNLYILVKFHFDQDYIIKNECINRFKKKSTCHGKCVLSARFDQYREKTSSKKIINLKEIRIIGLLNTIANNYVISTFLDEKKTEIIGFNSQYTYFFNPSIFHPPQSSRFL